ncbi:TetR/AcrR family transcriptional regulator [Ktedonospora formicarum]|uniref:TetR family transcriptional regulator n=1 Tax=Ktedonospora formicarum TaxID=2778364 RepID=A0A8J3HXV2_9CHLR|nr:TetR family transcriptional regulator [Ktedonospora formicarum]GHO46187.1 TetR family transcriptional regulator [Ktedonospora formicarum]
MSIRDKLKNAQSCPRQRRERDAAATRKAILHAARTLFAQDSYERVTVRDIASQAHIDPALVIRYFGSKEDLFQASISIEGSDCGPSPFEGDLSELGQRLIHSFISHAQLNTPDPLMIMIRSAHCDEVSHLLRQALEEHFLGPMATYIGGSDAHLRAELILSQLIGLSVMQSFIHSESLAQFPDEQLTRIIGAALQRSIEDDLP